MFVPLKLGELQENPRVIMLLLAADSPWTTCNEAIVWPLLCRFDNRTFND